MRRRWWQKTTRSMAAEFGPPPAVAYPELQHYSDRALIERDTAGLLAEIEAQRAAIARLLAQAEQLNRQEVTR